MSDIYAVMLSWAVTLSGYGPPAEQPKITQVEHAELVQRACGGRECKVLGWYPPGGTIYLDRRLDPEDSLFASSIVVHEMVHYLQEASGKFAHDDPCKTALLREREAYAVQKEFLVRYGVFQQVGLAMHGAGCELAAGSGH
jgi:hypothetical protein